MPQRTGRARPLVAGLIAAGALAAAPAAEAVPTAESSNGSTAKRPAARAAQKHVTVMTRNIYLGGDIMRPIRAVQPGMAPLEALAAFANANAELRDIVDQTDFRTRARLLAREFKARKPDLVGLQEVALWRRGPMQLDRIGVSNAKKVDLDFLKILRAELRRAKIDYVPVHVQKEADVEGPGFRGTDPGADPNAADLRLTMRDVILRRAGSRVKVVRKGGAQFDTHIPVTLSGVTFRLVRGYNWADARLGRKRIRFINTHLESVSSDVALGQAKELLAGPADKKGRVVIACDCNSDPLDHSVKAGQTTPHSGPYEFIDAQNFTDAWLEFAPAEEGFTSGFNELVNDPDATDIDHRIDLIWIKGGFDVRKGWIVGTDPDNRAKGLWPSDHAGVVMKLKP